MADPQRPARPPADGPVSRLLIEYDGTDFFGWAAQPGRRTIQAELERALAVVLRRSAAHPPTLTVAGRTDAGVHASGQVASYAGEPARVRAASMPCCPDDVVRAGVRGGRGRVLDARARRHQPRVSVHDPGRARERSALRTGAGYCTIRSTSTSTVTVQMCAARLLGGTPRFHGVHADPDQITVRFERDHRLHARSGTVAGGSPTRCWSSCIEGDAFMRHMNRVLVGTMLDVARGRRSVERIRRRCSAWRAPQREAGNDGSAGVRAVRSPASATAAGPRSRPPDWTNVRLPLNRPKTYNSSRRRGLMCIDAELPGGTARSDRT